MESNEKMMILVAGPAFYEKMELAGMAGGDVTNDEVLRWNPMTGSHFNNEGEQVIHNEDVNTVNDITFIDVWGVTYIFMYSIFEYLKRTFLLDLFVLT